MDRGLWERIRVVQGDITRERVAAIVNAANRSLLGGGGVDGAIHRAAGPELLEFCRTLGGCPTGEAKISPGFDLPAEFVIHTVGPVYRDGAQGEPEALSSCYRRSLEVAAEHDCLSVAFPAISTGVYGYPFEAASRIALRTTLAFLQESDSPEEVRFVLYGDGDYKSFHRILESVKADT